MSRTFDDTRLSRAQREAVYKRNARLSRERDRFPFSNFNARLFAERQAFDAWLDSREQTS